jgi:GntR family transcriptional repressor for pyruvate dehydrogenase complex
MDDHTRAARRSVEKREARAGRRGSRADRVDERSPVIPTALLTDRAELPDQEVAHLLESRRTIEMSCARLAALRASDDDLAALEGLVRELGETRAEPEAFIEADVRFHLRLAAASGNPYLASFLREVFRRLAATRSAYPTRYASMAAAEAYQQHTLDALQTRRPAAVAVSMDRHLAALEEHFGAAAVGVGLEVPA